MYINTNQTLNESMIQYEGKKHENGQSQNILKSLSLSIYFSL